MERRIFDFLIVHRANSFLLVQWHNNCQFDLTLRDFVDTVA